jgi:AI-2 transport protein TqsA
MTSEPTHRAPSSRAAIVFATLGFVALLYFGMEMAMPLTLGILLFFLLDPIVNELQRYRIPRVASSLFLILVFLVVILALGRGIYSGAARLTTEIPQYSEKLHGVIHSLAAKAQSIEANTQSLVPSAPVASDTQKVQVVSTEGTGLGTTLFRGMNSVFAILANLFLIPILAVFFLLEKGYLRTQFERSLGTAFPLRRAADEISEMVRAYFVGNLIVGLLTAVGFYILFWILGLENKAMLSLLAGFLNLIPIFGSIIGAILPAGQALLQFDHFSPVIIIFGTSILFHIIVNSIVIPKLVGARINVNASAATVGLVFWGWLWGGLGLLLAIPLMALLRIALATSPGTESWANLIAENAEFSFFGSRKKKSLNGETLR